MRIFVTGTRGIPDIPGGVEKHCQELYPRIAAKGHEVFVATRSCYVARQRDHWRGVRLVHIYAPRKKSIEALLHTFLALLKSRRFCPDVVHIHAIGPSLVTPLAKLMGLRVVITNHGPEYERQKWGRVAKIVLRVSERIGATWADEVIGVSAVVQNIIRKRCHREIHVVPNGVNLAERSEDTDYLDRIGVKPGRYVLSVARFVPEKGLHDLMWAYRQLKVMDHLVIAGDADHESEYSRAVRQMAKQDDRIVLTGYITGDPLNQLYSHAGLFVLPSYHEGLPIVLLEAMSYEVPVLASDIPANKEVGLPDDRYFRCGDVTDLKEKISSLIGKRLTGSERDSIHTQLAVKYNWDHIADQTIEVYKQAVL